MTSTTHAPPFARARAAAGVLFTNDQGEVLLVAPSYKDYLDIPGGCIEPGESPVLAARREVHEELPINPRLNRLLVVDWWTESREQASDAKILLVFDGGTLDNDQVDAIAVDGDEIVAWAFHPPEAIDRLTIPRLAHRLRHAVAARRDLSIRYLEDGRPNEHG